MADVKNINGYNIKDEVARNSLLEKANISDLNEVKTITMNNVQLYNVPIIYEDGYYWKDATKKAYTSYSAAEMNVSLGEVIEVCTYVSATTDYDCLTTIDSSGNIIRKINLESGIGQNFINTITIQQNEVKLLITCIKSGKSSSYYKSSKPLIGKTIAIIGDSISTNGDTGDCPNVPEVIITNDDVGKTLSAYLTHWDLYSASGKKNPTNLTIGGHLFTDSEMGTEVTFIPTVEDVGKMVGKPYNYNTPALNTWWEQLCKYYGMNATPVCWSGSSITSHSAGSYLYYTAHAWHEAQIRKCGKRIEGTMDRIAPDIIAIYRGTNDFSKSPFPILTNDYFNVNWQYPETDNIGERIYGLKEGLSLTIKKLRDTYPNATIVLCTLNLFKRTVGDYGNDTLPIVNGVNTLQQYNDAIREVADFFGCQVIEFDKDGITDQNFITYCTETGRTHPNQLGHDAMGKQAIKDLQKIF